jgi:hypothetical protein
VCKRKKKKNFKKKKKKKKKKKETNCAGFFGRARTPSARCCCRRRIRSRSSGESAIGVSAPLIDVAIKKTQVESTETAIQMQMQSLISGLRVCVLPVACCMAIASPMGLSCVERNPI